jgi:hypothetical protein
MSAYIVRIKKNHEFVGFFVVQRVAELFWLIDEATDPHACECRVIGSGGVYWPRQGEITIPAKDDPDDGHDMPSQFFSLTDRWDMALIEDGEKWRSIPHEALAASA